MSTLCPSAAMATPHMPPIITNQTTIATLRQTCLASPGPPCRCLNETEKFTQEFRLSAPIGHSIEWLLGAFYTHENSPADEIPVATNPATGALVGSIEDFDFPTSLLEYALFGDLTSLPTSPISSTCNSARGKAGIVRHTDATDSGPITEAFYSVPSPLVNPAERTSASSSTYLLTPQFKISPDLMVYVRVASGYTHRRAQFQCGAGSYPP